MQYIFHLIGYCVLGCYRSLMIWNGTIIILLNKLKAYLMGPSPDVFSYVEILISGMSMSAK